MRVRAPKDFWSVFSVAVFVYGLRLPLSLWPAL
jgi:hypothetical protein